MFDSHGYPWNIYRIKTMKDTDPFLTRKVFWFLIISPLLLISKKCASFFCRETVNENKHLKETKTWISNSYFIRQSFWGCRCKSTLTIFAYKVTWNYTFIFFNFRNKNFYKNYYFRPDFDGFDRKYRAASMGNLNIGQFIERTGQDRTEQERTG